MDSYRDDFGHHRDYDVDLHDDGVAEAPPPAIGTDERRMQVRAYNHWASLLHDRPFPCLADLATGSLPDFDPYSVLLDFSGGLEDPAIRFLGGKLADECGASATTIRTLSDVPSRSLLSRITDHYLQIHANQAPIGFEAEFVNSSGRTILYRGILLPFSGHDGSTEIDQIYGVINWKELADQETANALLSEIDRALEARPHREAAAITDWADGPMDGGDDVFDLVTPLDGGDTLQNWPTPDFGESSPVTAMSLADLLDSARELARAAQGSEDRSRQALYSAIGRAWDFALVAHEQPDDFRELVLDAGLTMQDRAPFTPVVKLVFGADYDKTRLTEYATAMVHAQRNGIGRGELTGLLTHSAGGLKGVVQTERKLRKAESGKPTARDDTSATVLRLRAQATRPLAEISSQGDEFAVVVVRRTPEGKVLLVGEVTGDVSLLERASRRLVA